MTNYRQNQKQHYISLRGDTVGIISSIYNSGYNINRLFLGEQELKLAYLGEQIVFNEVIDDLNYVLYEFYKGKTISNTIEAPVKRAILKGQTLVNFAQNEQGDSGVSDIELTEGRLTWTAQQEWGKLYFVVNGKPNTKYIIKYQSRNKNIGIFYRPETTDPHSGWFETISVSNQTITTYNEGTFVVSLENASVSSDLWIQDFMIIEYQEGMENWDIPYFEDMQSVKMPVLTTSNEDGTKTNILTVNEDVTLRSNGDVYDELNLLTGRLTQRIDENNEVLVQEVIKTVDLTMVDQDEQTISKLNSFNGTTHVSTEVAENNIYPMVSLEVASELQAAMSKVAEDIELIKPVQNDIETTLDTQSNDIDSLLLATTELFEMFL